MVAITKHDWDRGVPNDVCEFRKIGINYDPRRAEEGRLQRIPVLSIDVRQDYFKS
jgi:hypothetical protein